MGMQINKQVYVPQNKDTASHMRANNMQHNMLLQFIVQACKAGQSQDAGLT